MIGKPMKHLILLFLLILPFSVHSQITLNDLKKLDSEEDFQRLCIEQGFEKDNSVIHHSEYAFQPNADFSSWYIHAKYYGSDKYDDQFFFKFAVKSTDGDFYGEYNEAYQKIVSDIKNSCNFYKVRNSTAFYSCPGSLYPGKIGFKVSGNLGIVQTYNFQD